MIMKFDARETCAEPLRTVAVAAATAVDSHGQVWHFGTAEDTRDDTLWL